MTNRLARTRPACLLAAFSLAVALAAQDPAPTAPPPEPRLVYTMEVQGPAAWRATFGVTNVGSFLASEAGQGLSQQLIRPLEAMVQRALGADDKAYGLARERLLDYSGDFRFATPALYEWYAKAHPSVAGKPHLAQDLFDRAVYGIPELNREAIRTAKVVGNPGCFAVAMILSLLPAIQADQSCAPIGRPSPWPPSV